MTRQAQTSSATVQLYWLPLGADGNPVVRWCGRLYEAAAARHECRQRYLLYHSALRLHLGEETFVIEMAPVWRNKETERGVVAEGPVGLPWLGRSSLFRYEVRRWCNGVIPDQTAAVNSPVCLTVNEHQARQLLELVASCPTPTWGLDEYGVGDMWNSNSLTSWLLARGGLAWDTVAPPAHGRAPGWDAGVRVAQRQQQDASHAGSRGPTPMPSRRRSRLRLHAQQFFEVVVAIPWFCTTPLYRRWHLRWGATDEEVLASMPGDDLLAVSHFAATRAISIDAPPRSVWPWLVQVGFGRAGFYSYDLLDSLGVPSAVDVLEPWQHPRPGTIAAPMTGSPTPATSFTVAAARAPEHLVWVKPNSTWAWRLTPLDDGGTRLVTRLKQRYRPGVSLALTLPLLEFGDFPMMRKMLRGIKDRAEASTPVSSQTVATRVAMRVAMRVAHGAEATPDHCRPTFAAKSAPSRAGAECPDTGKTHTGQPRLDRPTTHGLV